jgi:hypothetical protein
MYFPLQTREAEIKAVERIMAGELCSGAGGAEMKPKKVDLRAGAVDGVYSVSVPSVLRLDVDLAPGRVPMEPLPALDSWSNTVTYARNICARIDDPTAGLKWDYSGQQANYRSFEITSDLVERGLMLALFRDDTGRFNEMHRSLIRELHLEVPLSAEEFEPMIAQVHLPARVVPDKIYNQQSGSVSGTVFGVDGQPRSGARIRCSGPNSSAVPVIVTNPGGRYFLARVPAGTFQLCATSWDGTTAAESCAGIDVKSGITVQHDFKLMAKTN